jgi:uncharacterized protein YneF (UPF0154 family)
MLTYILIAVVCLVIGAAGGLLIGRKNPKAADVAVQIADKVSK